MVNQGGHNTPKKGEHGFQPSTEGKKGLVEKKSVKKVKVEEKKLTHEEYLAQHKVYSDKIFDNLHEAIMNGNVEQKKLYDLYWKAFNTLISNDDHNKHDIYLRIVARAERAGTIQEVLDKILDDSIKANSGGEFVLLLINNNNTSNQVLTKLVDYPAKKKDEIFNYDNGKALNYLAANPNLSVENMKKLLDKYGDKREDDRNVTLGVLYNTSVTKDVLKYMLEMQYPGKALENAYDLIPGHRLMDAELAKAYVNFVLENEEYLLKIVGNQFLEEEDLKKMFKTVLNFDYDGRKISGLEDHVKGLLRGHNERLLPSYFTEEKLEKMISLYKKEKDHDVWGNLRR